MKNVSFFLSKYLPSFHNRAKECLGLQFRLGVPFLLMVVVDKSGISSCKMKSIPKGIGRQSFLDWMFSTYVHVECSLTYEMSNPQVHKLTGVFNISINFLLRGKRMIIFEELCPAYLFFSRRILWWTWNVHLSFNLEQWAMKRQQKICCPASLPMIFWYTCVPQWFFQQSSNQFEVKWHHFWAFYFITSTASAEESPLPWCFWWLGMCSK